MELEQEQIVDLHEKYEALLQLQGKSVWSMNFRSL